MALTVPKIEPTEIQAGNTLRFDRTFADFPASTWTLTYVLRSRLPSVAAVVLTGVANADTFEINETAATTSQWTPGDYTMIGYVSLSPDRYEVFRQQIKIAPDVATLDLPYDGRTFYERLLQQVRDVIESGVVREVIRYSFNGVSTEVQSLADAFKAEAYLVSKVAQEKSSGKQRKVLTRFTRAR